MKKSRVSLLLVLVLVSSLFSACGSSDAIKEDTRPVGEILKESIDKQNDINSAHTSTTISLQATLSEELKANPVFASVVPFAEGSDLTIESDYLIKENKGHVNLNFATKANPENAMFSADAFLLSEKEFAVQTPMYPQIILLNADELEEMAKEQGQNLPQGQFANSFANGFKMGMNKEEMKPMLDFMFDFYGEVFKGVEPTERGLKKIKFGEEEKDLNVITYSYKSNDDVIALGEKVAKNVLESEKIYDLLTGEEFTKLMKQQMEMQGLSEEDAKMPSKEEFEEGRKLALENFDAGLEEAKNTINEVAQINEVTLSMGFDKDSILVYSNIVLDVVAKQEGIEIPAKIVIESKATKINEVKAEDIKTVEINDTNSIKFKDLMEQFN